MYKLKQEKSKIEIEYEVDAARWEEGVQKVYEDTKSRYNITGFRKGHAPKKVIEQHYGENVFFEDAVNYFAEQALNEVYANELKLEPVSQPEVEFESFSKENGLKIKIKFEVMPEFTLGQYKGLTVKVPRHEVTDHDVDHYIEHFRQQSAKFEDVEREVKNGDNVLIDFMGFVDDEAFEGGEANDYPLTIGSHTFIDTFEEQLIGAKKGDKIDVNVTFPENYGHEKLAGKPATFKVEIKQVREMILPELDDKFVSDTTEYETVEEYKKSIFAHIQSMQENSNKQELYYQLVHAVLNNTEMEIPETMIQSRIDNTIKDMNDSIAAYGMTLGDYLAQTGTSLDEYILSLRDKTIEGIKIRHIYRKLIEVENLNVTAEELAENTKDLKDQQAIANKENELLIDKIMKFLIENNNIEYINE